MALDAAIIWEVRTGGADTNGGGFKLGASGTDHTLQDAAQYAVTDAVTDGTTTITSATASFGTDVVGNTLYITGGTGSITAAWYEITVRTDASTITVDRSTGLTAGTGATLNIGGSLASPGQASASKVGGNTVYIKAGTYTLSSSSANVAGGVVADADSTAHQEQVNTWVGYTSTRTLYNTDVKPVFINAAYTGITMVATTGSYNRVINLEIDGNSAATTKGLTGGAGKVQIERCKVQNCTSYGIQSTDGRGAIAIGCEVTGCSGTSAFEVGFVGSAFACWSHNNTTHGFTNAGGGNNTISHCIASNNSGAAVDGFNFSGAPVTLISSASYGNGRAGAYLESGARVWSELINCLFENNGTYGIDSFNATLMARLINCGTYNNTSGKYNTAQITIVSGHIDNTTGSFFTAAGSDDFSLNNTAGQGAAARAAGYPATFQGGLTASALDIGAAQHADAGGATGGVFF